MDGKIAFEEHFAIEDTLEQSRSFAGDSGVWDDFTRQLLDLDSERLGHMDAAGIEFALLSLNAPGVQRIPDPRQHCRSRRRPMKRWRLAVAKHPKRYAALAALPMHDPDVAARELERCVKELGFKGALVNGFQQVGTEEECQVLRLAGVPEFLGNGVEARRAVLPASAHADPIAVQELRGPPLADERAVGFLRWKHRFISLRLCGSGLFDDFPDLRICIGHLGENIPFGLWRIDARMRFSRREYRGKRPLGDYFRDHFHITTSGNFNDPAFRCTLDVLDENKVYFSADYPFEKMEDAASWYDSSRVVSDAQRRKIGRGNAIKLFNLDLE